MDPKTMAWVAGGIALGMALAYGMVQAQSGAPKGDKKAPKISFTKSGERVERDPMSPDRPDKLILTEAEWKKRLTPEQFKILRAKGTEIPFCSPLLDNKKAGSYHCVGCDLELFRTDSKFDSRTGWPSFFQPAAKDVVWTKPDFSHGMIRTEILCARCDGHLGHVFEDGPRPTGLRYCVNGEALKFVARK